MPNWSSDPEAFAASEDAVEPAAIHVKVDASAALRAQQARIDAALRDIEDKEREALDAATAQLSLMNEARVRFAKAALYEQIIEGQLFEGDDPVTIEVENEFKAFAEEQLMMLLGIQSEKQKRNASPFDDDQENVLKLFANKMLGRPAAIPRPTEAPKPAGQLQPRPAPAPVPAGGTLAAPKRGRGRPPGTGKNQRAAAAANLAAQQGAQQALIIPPVARAAPKQDPAATTVKETRTVTLPNGQIREVPVERGQVRPTGGPKPVPMPSPDEMIATAAQHGNQGFTQSAIGKEAPSLQTTLVQSI